MSLIFSNSHFAGGFGPKATSNDFRRNCELNPNVSKKIFNWQKYTNLIKLKKWPLIFLLHHIFCLLYLVITKIEIFLCKQFYVHRSYFYRKLMHFTWAGGNFCLSVAFISSRIGGKNSLYYLSEVFFSYLLSIHHVISVLCTVLLSPRPYSIGFIPIFQMHLLLPLFHRTCQSIPMYCLSPYH